MKNQISSRLNRKVGGVSTTFSFVFLVSFIPFLLKAQITKINNTDLDTTFIGDSITIHAAKPELIDFEAMDSIELIEIDSIIKQLDSIRISRFEGKFSKIYGHDMLKKKYGFESVDSTNTFVKIPDSYVMGVGDELSIAIFGASQFDGKFIINKDGFISPTGMPKILLKGLDWGQAKSIIRSRFSNYYIFRREQFAVSLSQPRTITVNIFGEVEIPGSFQLSGINTAFNAIIAAGGITEKGSVRNIRVISGAEIKELDIYELVEKPESQFLHYLEDNAIIQVPGSNRIVQITGAIQRPFKYELKQNEGLVDLINYAGGLAANAVKELAQIKRYTNDQQELFDIELENTLEQNRHFALFNGDIIEIKTINEDVKNAVTIEGAVEFPGDYSLKSTQRISTLLKKANLKKEARLDVAFLMRTNRDSTSSLIQLNLDSIIKFSNAPVDLFLYENDQLKILEKARFVNKTNVKVSGAVREEIEIPFDPDSTITIQRAILLAGGLAPEARDIGYIIRKNINNRNDIDYINVNIREALLNPESEANIKLKPLDELLVQLSSEFMDSTTVTIEGAVRNPVILQYSSSLTIKDILILSNGFLPEASSKLDVFRVIIDKNKTTETRKIATLEVDDEFNVISGGDKDFAIKSYDKIIARTVPDFKLQSFVQVLGEVQFPGSYAITEKNETLYDLIQKAGGLTIEAFPEGVMLERNSEEESFVMITKLEEVLKNTNSKYNYVLRDYDVITVPPKKDMVFINIKNTKAEELYHGKFPAGKIAVAYQAGKSAKWYIDNYAAGIGNIASKENVTVEYANGEIKGTKKIGLFKKYPKLRKGATISIGSKQKLDELKNSDTNNSQYHNAYPKLKEGVIINVGTEGVKIEGAAEENPDQSEEDN